MTLPIYVISMKDSADRRKVMTARLAKLGLSFDFIDGIDGRALTEAEFASYVSPQRQYHLKWPLSFGALGCALSHMKAWQAIIDSGTDMGLVFEDDAVPHDDLPQILERLEALKGKIDIVNLHFRGWKPLINIAPISPDHHLTSCRYNQLGMESCVISRKAAQRLLAQAQPIIYEVDIYLNRWWDHGLHVLNITPPVAHEDDSPSTIGYSAALPKWPDDRISHLLCRRLRRLMDSIDKRRMHPSLISAMKKRLEGINDHGE
jgi:glycosyl transferase family 25